jgi:NAD(P)-dependent dehydrogenase (short-subunit alcohol dehydrogenase family)
VAAGRSARPGHQNQEWNGEMSQVQWDFRDRRVLVTGAASGIGLAIADAFARADATVVLLGRNRIAVAHAVAELKQRTSAEVHPVVCDLAAPAEITAAAREVTDLIGGVDILVNNAGVSGSCPITELTDQAIDLDLHVNLRAPILLTRELIRGMLNRGNGVIINIASQAGKRGFSGISHYSASKAGILGFTRSLAAEVAPTVRVNAICPGMIMTPLMQKNINRTSETKKISVEEAAAEWGAGIPMGGMQTPRDVANAALFLSSDHAAQITGEAMNVSGGQTTN